MCFNEISSLTFDFQKYGVHTLSLTKITRLYLKIDNSATNLLFIDVDCNIYMSTPIIVIHSRYICNLKMKKNKIL